MKRFLAFALFAASVAHATTLHIALTNFPYLPPTNKLQFFLTRPASDGSTLAVGQPIQIQYSHPIDTNLFPARYELRIIGQQFPEPLLFTLNDTNATQNLAELLSTNAVTYVAAPWVEQIIAGENIEISPTNGKGRVTITAIVSSDLTGAVTNFGTGTNVFLSEYLVTNSVSTNTIYVYPSVGEVYVEGIYYAARKTSSRTYWTNANGSDVAIVFDAGGQTFNSEWNFLEDTNSNIILYEASALGGPWSNSGDGIGASPVPTVIGYGTYKIPLSWKGYAEGDALKLTNLHFNGQPITGIATSSPSAFISTGQVSSISVNYSQLVKTPMDSVLNPPQVGPSKSAIWRGRIPTGAGGPPGPAFAGLFYYGAGVSGVIRRIQWVGAEGHDSGSDQLTNLVLRVYCDSGDISDFNNPPASKLTFSAPVNMLLNNKYRTLARTHGSRYVNSQDKPGTLSGFELMFLHQFTNGAYVAMFNTTTNALYNYSSITHEIGPLNYAWSDLRCRSRFLHTNSTYNAGDFDGSNRLFVGVTNSPGFLLGIMYANGGTTNNVAWEEANWEFVVDYPFSPAIRYDPYIVGSVGGEDLFMNSYYFGNAVNEHYDYGTAFLDSPTISGVGYRNRMEGYRWFSNGAIQWTNSCYGIKGVMPGITNMVEDYLTIYYAR